MSKQNKRFPLMYLSKIVCLQSLYLWLLLFSFAYAQDIKLDQQNESKAASETLKAPLPIELLQEFGDVYQIIKNQYVEKVNDNTILSNAIRGMMSELDPHSAYLDEQEYAELMEDTSGEFSGLGIEIGMKDGYVIVIAALDDSPAQRSGVRSGDIILAINGTRTQGMKLDEAAKLMRGKTGEKINLSILHEEDKTPQDIEIIRAVIHLSSVKVEALEKSYIYARISSFNEGTIKELKKKLRPFLTSTVNGMIVDLRNNPGGVLMSAVDVAGLFLDEKLVVTTEGRNSSALIDKLYSTPGDILNNQPLVVLINRGSASASEVVAGALQDYKRAVILGETSFGKGSVQSIIGISEKTAVKLTTARYFTPLHRSIQAQGIVPDIRVAEWKLEKLQPKKSAIKEANLKGHLVNPTATKNSPKTTTDSSQHQLLAHDYVLNEAMNLLKALHIIHSK